jgi:integrase
MADREVVLMPGGGSVRELEPMKDGTQRWRVTLELPHARNERCTLRRTVRGKRRDAVAAYRALLNKRERGTLVPPGRRTVGWLFNRWLDDHVSTLEAQTQRRYESLVATHLRPLFGEWRIDDVKNNAVRDKLAEAKNVRTGKPLSGQTRLHIFRALAACLNWAATEEYIPPVVAQRLKAPRVQQAPERPVMPPEDLLALLPKLAGERTYSPKAKHLRNADDKGPLLVYVPALLMAFCGLRVGEVCGLQWSDVDFTNRVLHVRRVIAKDADKHPYVKEPKTRQTRVVPLPADVVDALTTEKVRHDENVLRSGGEWNPDGWIVPDDNGGPRLPQTIGSSWRAFATRYGYSGRLYDLRHTYASLRIHAGEPLPLTAALMGHNPRQTAQTYAHAYRAREARGDVLMDTILDDSRAKTVQQETVVVPLTATDQAQKGV